MTVWLGKIIALVEDLTLILSTICNSSSMGSDILL